VVSVIRTKLRACLEQCNRGSLQQGYTIITPDHCYEMMSPACKSVMNATENMAPKPNAVIRQNFWQDKV
jgi:hypothetical protein